MPKSHRHPDHPRPQPASPDPSPSLFPPDESSGHDPAPAAGETRRGQRRGEDSQDDPSGIVTGPSGDPDTAVPVDPATPAVPLSYLGVPLDSDQTRRIDALLGTHDDGSRFRAEDLRPCRLPTDLFAEIIEAADHALTKHGPPTTDPVRACGVLTEELGEATECALKATSRDPEENRGMSNGYLLNLREELLQLAGYACLQIVNIDRGRISPAVSTENIDRALGVNSDSSNNEEEGA